MEIRTVVFSLESCVFYPMKRAPRVCGVRARMYIGSSLDVFEQLILNRCGNSSRAKHNAIDNRLSNKRARRRRVYKSRRVKTSDFFSVPRIIRVSSPIIIILLTHAHLCWEKIIIKKNNIFVDRKPRFAHANCTAYTLRDTIHAPHTSNILHSNTRTRKMYVTYSHLLCIH